MTQIFNSTNRKRMIRFALLVAAMVATACAGYFFAPRFEFSVHPDEVAFEYGAHGRSAGNRAPTVCEFETVVRDDFQCKVRGRGGVESVVNTDIINQVDGISTLTYVIEEGTNVKAGDVIARLDPQKCYDLLIENLLIELRIKTLVITRQANLEEALIGLQEYVYGTFEQEWIKLENKLFENQQTFRSKGDLKRYRQRMVQMGYSTNLLLDNYTASWEDAQNNVYKAVWDQNVLLKHSSESKIATIVSAIDMWSAAVNVAATIEKIRHYYVCKAKIQLQCCTIVAPCDGPVVYANQLVRTHRRSEANMIREGGAVMSGQLLFRIPGSDQIQIQTLINETDVSALTTGMNASIVFGIDPSHSFEGVVTRVNLYPEFIWRSSAKNYLISVEVKNLEQVRKMGIDLRTGISADVEINTGMVKDAMLIPLHCLLYWGDETYCLARDENGWKTLPVKIGASDDTRVVVLEGLTEGMQVVAHAEQYASEIVLPDMINDSTTQNKTSPPDQSSEPNGSAAKTTDRQPVAETVQPLSPSASLTPHPSALSSSQSNPDQATTAGVPRESEQFRKQLDNDYHQELLRLEPLKEWFQYSSMEMCRMLDYNRDKIISPDEAAVIDPAFLAFYRKWDRDHDGLWSLVDFVFYFHKARSLWLESSAKQADKAENKQNDPTENKTPVAK